MRRNHLIIPALVAALALPAGAAAADHPGKGPKQTPPGQAKKPPATTNPPAGSPDATYSLPNGNAYGVLCKGFSKRHVKGTKGTPFSRCVNAMAKLDKGTTTSPAKACKGLSKKKLRKVRGKTQYAACVSAGKKLKRSIG